MFNSTAEYFDVTEFKMAKIYGTESSLTLSIPRDGHWDPQFG